MEMAHRPSCLHLQGISLHLQTALGREVWKGVLARSPRPSLGNNRLPSAAVRPQSGSHAMQQTAFCTPTVMPCL